MIWAGVIVGFFIGVAVGMVIGGTLAEASFKSWMGLGWSTLMDRARDRGSDPGTERAPTPLELDVADVFGGGRPAPKWWSVLTRPPDDA